MRGVLWILGEYCDGSSRILRFVTEIRKSIGDLPIVESELKLAAGEAEEKDDEEKVAQVNVNSINVHRPVAVQNQTSSIAAWLAFSWCEVYSVASHFC